MGEEPGGLQSMGSQRVGHNWATSLTHSLVVLESVLVSFFTSRWPVFPAPLVKKIVFSPLYILAFFVKDKVSTGAWIYLWAFCFVPLTYISVFVPIPYCLDDCKCCSIIWSQAVWFLQFHSLFSRLPWLFEVSVFPKNCATICSSSLKNTIGSLIRIALNL